MNYRSAYEIDNSISPPSILPRNLSRNLVDVTCVGDQWRKFLDIDTGKVHDGAVYYEEYLLELKGILHEAGKA